MLCLAYAYKAKSEINRLFIRVGREGNQGNQLAHECGTLSNEDIMDKYFDEALKQVDHEEVLKLWCDCVICSCISAQSLHDIIQDQNMCSKDYVINKYNSEIIIYDAQLNVFL